MSLNVTRTLLSGFLGTTAVVALLALGGLAQAQQPTSPPGLGLVNQYYRFAAGSWFGRAIPVPGGTICPPGAPGCAVPAEIIMAFTLNADGTFIGIDSSIFAGGSHSTAHGQWAPSGPNSVKATFTLLQSSPAGVFIGGFKNLFEATVVDPNTLNGKINAFLYQYTNEKGAAIVGADGLPTPNPLGKPADCAKTPGCVPLGQFTFKARRVEVQE